jgi:hypothetical protein
MIAMSEFYIILDKREIGANVEKLLAIFRAGGKVESLDGHSFKINNASETDQISIFRAIEKAMDLDFPTNCVNCGSSPEDCDCE